MKCVIIGLMVACVVLMAQSQGIPTRSCPAGEHSVLYCPQKLEPTCDQPYLHDPEYPMPCDIPKCFCNTGTIRNTLNDKCVEPQNC